MQGRKLKSSCSEPGWVSDATLLIASYDAADWRIFRQPSQWDSIVKTEQLSVSVWPFPEVVCMRSRRKVRPDIIITTDTVLHILHALHTDALSKFRRKKEVKLSSPEGGPDLRLFYLQMMQYRKKRCNVTLFNSKVYFTKCALQTCTVEWCV